MAKIMPHAIRSGNAADQGARVMFALPLSIVSAFVLLVIAVVSNDMRMPVSRQPQSAEDRERLKDFGMTAIKFGYNCRELNIGLEQCQRSMRRELDEADKELR